MVAAVETPRMTEMEIVAAGVAFTRSAAGLRIHAPKDRPELGEIIRAEIARRVWSLREFRPDRSAGYGRCETCGDPLAPYRGGMCALCACARQKVMSLVGEIKQ